MKHKLVLVGPVPPPVTGLALAFSLLTEGLKEQGITFKLVNISRRGGSLSGLSRPIEYLGIFADFFGKVPIWRRGTVYITVAQSPQGFLRDCVMIYYSKLLRHRVVCHLHGGNYADFYDTSPSWLQSLIRRTLIKIDKMIVLGEQLRSMFDFEPELKARISIVPNGLPYKLKEPVEAKRLPRDTTIKPINILYLSNLIESKGYLDVLGAVNILVKDYGVNVHCDFCGEFLENSDDITVRSKAHAEEIFSNFVKCNELDWNVSYRGVVSGDQKSHLLNEAHFLVLPTNYNNEGQPISIIEAMAYGCVVISTNFRAIPDMIEDGRTGYFVPFGDSYMIAKKIVSLLEKPTEYSEVSQMAVEKFRNGFTRDAHLNNLIPHLKN